MAVLTNETEVKYQIEKTVPKNVGDMALEKMIMDNLSKIGLMITSKGGHNPILVREAMRPSLISQHQHFQTKKK